MDCHSPFDTKVLIPGTVIVSPSIPTNVQLLRAVEDYEHWNLFYKSCEISLEFPANVRTTFLEYTLQGSDTCVDENITFLDGPNTNLSQIGPMICGFDFGYSNLPRPIQSTGNTMHILYNQETIYPVSGTGFKMKTETGKTF